MDISEPSSLDFSGERSNSRIQQIDIIVDQIWTLVGQGSSWSPY